MNILECLGGSVSLPDEKLVLVDREDGGNLIVTPQREVWDRRELTPDELTRWSFLVTATASAMLDTLPQLEGGCVNYWDAGNWALNADAPPAGPKNGPQHRRVHLHLLGRSRFAKSAVMRWGEAPMWPAYVDRFEWAANNKRLTPDECAAIAERARTILVERYGFQADTIIGGSPSSARARSSRRR